MMYNIVCYLAKERKKGKRKESFRVFFTSKIISLLTRNKKFRNKKPFLHEEGETELPCPRIPESNRKAH